MNWRGDPHLSITFIPFLAGLAIFMGEIFPVWMDRLGGKQPGAPGVKESMFVNPGMFFGALFFYAVLATFFWWLYRKINWKIVAVVAVVAGVLLEFFLFKPTEAGGPNVVMNPFGALL